MASAEVSEESVYLCTGSPLPTDIEAVCQALFNEDFVDVYARVGDMQVAKGLALVDIVQQLLPCAPPRCRHECDAYSLTLLRTGACARHKGRDHASPNGIWSA